MAKSLEKILPIECSKTMSNLMFEVVPKVIQESVMIDLFDIDPPMKLETHLELELNLDQLEEPDQ